jgi:hypothetical protein
MKPDGFVIIPDKATPNDPKWGPNNPKRSVNFMVKVSEKMDIRDLYPETPCADCGSNQPHRYLLEFFKDKPFWICEPGHGCRKDEDTIHHDYHHAREGR